MIPARTIAGSISRIELLQWFHEGKSIGKDFVLVDLRRTDFEGGTIRGSVNLPSQSLYPTIPTLYSVLSQGGIANVVWYCGSSRGRGVRAANWFAEYLEEQKDMTIKSLVLEGGINGWAAAGDSPFENELKKIVDYMKDFITAHHSRMRARLEQPAANQLVMIAGKPALEYCSMRDTKDALEELDEMLVHRLRERI